MIRSGGVLKKDAITVWAGTPAQWEGWPTRGGSAFPGFFGAGWTYSELYRKQLWVAALVNKIGHAAARLPLKTYIRKPDGSREDGAATPYGQLLANPSTRHDPYEFWLWVVKTLNIQGEAFLGKVRDRGGRPIELVPLHPNYVRNEVRDDRVAWWFENSSTRVDIPRRDLVHFRLFNPDSVLRGLSPLEPLRATLENEEGARRANSALWRNGGRPSVVLEHPDVLTVAGAERLAMSWSAIHGGVDNWAKAAILEEGMKANVLPLNVEELQYIEARKLNREECCAAFDVPPPVVHILDHATYSNITEQMRSMYRDTMAPKLAQLESTLKFELRDGRFGDRTIEPDFGDDVYAEFLMDGVLRGDFENRVAAYATGINSGWLMPSEVRELENMPFVDGSDHLLIQGALTPLVPDTQSGASPRELAEMLQKIYLAVGTVITADEAREILNRGGAELDPDVSILPKSAVRSALGRLGRCKSMADLDIEALDAPVVLADLLGRWKSSNTPIAAVRANLAALVRGETQ